MEPALAVACRLRRPVAADHVGPTDQQFAHAILYVAQAARPRRAPASRMDPTWLRACSGARAMENGPVSVAPIDVAHRQPARVERLDQAGGQQAGSGPDGAQAGQVCAFPARMFDQGLHRGRHLQASRSGGRARSSRARRPRKTAGEGSRERPHTRQAASGCTVRRRGTAAAWWRSRPAPSSAAPARRSPCSPAGWPAYGPRPWRDGWCRRCRPAGRATGLAAA